MPLLPTGSVMQQALRKVWFALSCGMYCAKVARSTALYRTTSTFCCTACANADFWVSGVPSVLITFSVQPSRSVACLMMLPSIEQFGVPQLTNTTVLPLGTGLPIGSLAGISVGCWLYLSTSACSAASPALSPAPLVPPPLPVEPPEELLHPARSSAPATSIAIAPAAVRRRPRLVRRVVS